jgi:hypothetical protein
MRVTKIFTVNESPEKVAEHLKININHEPAPQAWAVARLIITEPSLQSEVRRVRKSRINPYLPALIDAAQQYPFDDQDVDELSDWPGVEEATPENHCYDIIIASDEVSPEANMKLFDDMSNRIMKYLVDKDK